MWADAVKLLAENWNSNWQKYRREAPETALMFQCILVRSPSRLDAIDYKL